MARKTSRTLYAILGLLSKGSASGYDLKKELEKPRYHFWNESYGQIYPMLHRLHKEGWAELEVEHQDSGPDRKIYSLTDSGRAHLERWLRQQRVVVECLLGKPTDPILQRVVYHLCPVRVDYDVHEVHIECFRRNRDAPYIHSGGRDPHHIISGIQRRQPRKRSTRIQQYAVDGCAMGIHPQ